MADFPDRIPLISQKTYAVSFDSILKTGRAHTGNFLGEMHFDRNGSDPVAAEYRGMREDLIRAARADEGVIHAPSQEAYERRLTTLITERFEKSPIFSSEHYTRQTVEGSQVRNINQLSPGKEYDCEAMGYIKGSLMQETDRTLVAEGIRKTPTDFYYVEGAVSVNPQASFDAHAYVVSKETGNIVESAPTKKEDIYQKSSVSFIEHMGGFPAITEQGAIYNGSRLFVDQNMARNRTESLMCAPNNVEALESMYGNANNETTLLRAARGNKFTFADYPAVATSRARNFTNDPDMLEALNAARHVDCSWMQSMPLASKTEPFRHESMGELSCPAPAQGKPDPADKCVAR